MLFTGQECAKLRIPRENVQLEKQKSICEANFAWIFACYWNGVNGNVTGKPRVKAGRGVLHRGTGISRWNLEGWLEREYVLPISVLIGKVL